MTENLLQLRLRAFDMEGTKNGEKRSQSPKGVKIFLRP